jgi:hypothetical protein
MRKKLKGDVGKIVERIQAVARFYFFRKQVFVGNLAQSLAPSASAGA